MPSAAVDAAFRARLTSLWTGSPVLNGTGVVEPPSDADAFLVVQYPVSNAAQPTLSEKRYWEEGAARLVLNVKSGIDLQAGLGLADTLAGLFRNQEFGGVETFVPSAPAINDANDDGNWFELSVIVPYRFEFQT